MCRCCQNCWEDFYWNCFEEKFCYDESIANYNPDDDDRYSAAHKNGDALGHIQSSTDNNNVTVVAPVCNQPLRRGGNPSSVSSAKIHEEDYRRETQTNVPMLGPEILAVFANSQIFQDHQPTKWNRISTKPNLLASVHSSHKSSLSDLKETEQDRLIRRLEANLRGDDIDSKTKEDRAESAESSSEKRITFTITTDSSPEGSQQFSPKKFDVIAEEDQDQIVESNSIEEEVILRPRLIDRHPHLMHGTNNGSNGPVQKKVLRSAKSVPHFNVRSVASETDIFAITGSASQISMTPEVPSISFSNLPKNYEDTPTIEKYRVSQSLYSIQTANAARISQDDFSMPRYFRRTMLSQSTDTLAESSTISPSGGHKDDNAAPRRPEKEKSKRLQMLRGNLPPLLIHSVSFRKNRDEAKQVD